MACPGSELAARRSIMRFHSMRALRLWAVRQFYEEQMQRFIQSMGVPAEFALAESGQLSQSKMLLDAQLFEAFLGRKE